MASSIISRVHDVANYDAARGILQKCQSISPDDVRTYSNLVALDSTWNDTKNLAESKPALEALCKRNNIDDPIVTFNFGVQAYIDVPASLR